MQKSKDEKKLSVRQKFDLAARVLVLGALLALLIYSCSNMPDEIVKPRNAVEFERTSAMITNLDEDEGGSGVIYHSSNKMSEVLTNEHVCKVVEHGGWVNTSRGRFKVIAFKESKVHDLCMVKVVGDLHVDTVVAKYSPNLGDLAIISGHPLLYPNMISKGYFGHRTEVKVQIGSTSCTFGEPGCDLIKSLFGEPVFRQYDAQLVSALILPGNSGSAVFNSDGEISGLAFASHSREISYAFIVPQAYVKLFVDSEAPAESWQKVQADTSAK